MISHNLNDLDLLDHFQVCSEAIVICQYFRSYYIAQSFLAAKKWTETIALYEKVLGYASTALTGFKKFKTGSIEVS